MLGLILRVGFCSFDLSFKLYLHVPFQKQQTVQAPATRMNLRSYRNVPLVPMETSSSDDSCDSFGSDGFANTVINILLSMLILLRFYLFYSSCLFLEVKSAELYIFVVFLFRKRS